MHTEDRQKIPFIDNFKNYSSWAGGKSFKKKITHEPYKAPSFVKPKKENINGMAEDAASGFEHDGLMPEASFLSPSFLDGIGFVNYVNLADLAQRAEFRKPCEVLSREMFREGIKIFTTSNENNDNGKIRHLNAALEKFQVMEVLQRQAYHSFIFGIGHLAINIKNQIPEYPFYDDKNGMEKGSLKSFKVIDPVWVTPQNYNTSNPLDDDFYKPSSWWVLGSCIDATRMMAMIPYEVADILKPCFNFGGLSLVQQLQGYVENYLKIRNSVANMTENSAKLVIKTIMTSTAATPMKDGGSVDMGGIIGRANLLQDISQGMATIICDKEGEDISIVSTPLGGLSDLQVKAMEAMASIPGIPLVKLFGITPSGLNASSDGEIRVFYDEIAGLQKKIVAPVLKKILRILQLNEFGEIDENIKFEFLPLWQMSEKEQVDIESIKAGIDSAYLEGGVIDGAEVRERLKKDHDSIYRGQSLEEEEDKEDESF